VGEKRDEKKLVSNLPLVPLLRKRHFFARTPTKKEIQQNMSVAEHVEKTVRYIKTLKTKESQGEYTYPLRRK